MAKRTRGGQEGKGRKPSRKLREQLEREWEERRRAAADQPRYSSLSRDEVDRLLTKRAEQIGGIGQRLIHTRMSDPRRRWRTYAKPGPVIVRKVER